MNPIDIRSSINLRNDFLAHLGRINHNQIARVTTEMIGRHATEDVIRNEATQAFYLGANRGIDTYKLEDDGRGNSSFSAFCRWRGLNYVKDFCRTEYGTDTRSVGKKYFERTNIILESDLYESTFNVRNLIDEINYDDSIVSLITIQEMICKLSPVDRSILQLLIFGKDEYGSIRNSSEYGSQYHHIAGDIALTIGRSKQFVYKRLSILKSTYSEMVA